ncbi:hypothetical protein BH23ACT9_BH23ACT9_07400 [soil metagenome]
MQRVTDPEVYRDQRLPSPTGRALAGAGGIAAILALLPGIGLYLAVVILPATYVVGVPTAAWALARVPGRRRRIRRLTLAGGAGGAAIGLAPSLPDLATPGSPLVAAGVLLAVATGFGLVVGLVGQLIAERASPRAARLLAMFGPLGFAVSAAVQVAIFP